MWTILFPTHSRSSHCDRTKHISIGYRIPPSPPLPPLLPCSPLSITTHARLKNVNQPSIHYLIAMTTPAQKRRYSIHGVVALVRWDGGEGNDFSSCLHPLESWLSKYYFYDNAYFTLLSSQTNRAVIFSVPRSRGKNVHPLLLQKSFPASPSTFYIGNLNKF